MTQNLLGLLKEGQLDRVVRGYLRNFDRNRNFLEYRVLGEQILCELEARKSTLKNRCTELETSLISQTLDYQDRRTFLNEYQGHKKGLEILQKLKEKMSPPTTVQVLKS